MKAYEFPVQVTAEGTLTLPHNVAEQLSKNQAVRVIILVREPSEAEE